MTDGWQDSGRRLPAQQVRIGDAERERAATALGEHFAAGRLTHEEFDTRLAAAYAARTHADLTRLFADLPEPGPGPRAALARPSGGRPAVRRTGVPVVAVVALVFLLAASIGAAVHGVPPFFLLAFVWWWGLGRRHRRHLPY